MFKSISLVPRFLIVAGVTAALSACVSITDRKSVDESYFSGYLSSYENLEYVAEQNAFAFREQAAKVNKKIYLEDFSAYGPQGVYEGELSDQALEYMQTRATAILERKGLLIDSPNGEDTVSLRFAITGTEKTNEDIQAYSFIPIGFVVSAGQVATGNRATFIEAAMEAEILDKNNEQMVAVVQKGIGDTDKRSGDELVFEDLVPIMDQWLIQFQEMIEDNFQ